MLFLSSCSNNNSDSVDSTDSTPSIIPEDAEYIATYGNYMYCALNLIDENSHAFLKIDTKTKRIDTLEYDVINYMIEKYKALDDGIVYVIKDGYGNMEDGSLEFLQIPEDKVINIFDLLNTLSLGGTLGDVTFHSDYLSSSIRFVNNSEEAQATYEFTYDSFPFNISYSDLKNKKVISAIEQSAKSYINQNDNSWLTKEEEERERAAAAEQERLEKESAPYGYNEYGEPYASRDHKNLDKALKSFEEARQGYINATYSRNPMDLMFYHQRMKNEIENCLYYARSIGDRDIINEIERLNRQVDNLQY